jgi:glycosyltransferase involved in cell wall biosynthesis
MTTPKLSIGLPVYNGEEFLRSSLDSLLAQTFTDFEIIISDNASTDSTAAICDEYLAKDERIRYIRQRVNIGAACNHNYVFTEARAGYFKWASHDDLYHPELLERCIEVLDEQPDIILVHADEAFIDEHGTVVTGVDYTLATNSPDLPTRFRSLLFGTGGDDFYGVIRSDVLRRVEPHDSYHHADRTFTTEIGLYGRFFHVPEVLYFRRDHPNRAERSSTIQIRCANLDPKRANRLRHPLPRLVGEYVLGYVSAIRRAPMSSRDRARCMTYLGEWLVSRTVVPKSRRDRDIVDPAIRAKRDAPIDLPRPSEPVVTMPDATSLAEQDS